MKRFKYEARLHGALDKSFVEAETIHDAMKMVKSRYPEEITEKMTGGGDEESCGMSTGEIPWEAYPVLEIHIEVMK